MSKKDFYHYEAAGLDIYLANGFSVEKTPYGEGITIKDVDGLHEAIAKDLIEKKGLLTPKEFRYLRNYLELSQGAFAGLFGRSAQTVARWEKGEIDIPAYADQRMRISVDAKLHDGTARIKELIDEINNIEAQCYRLKAKHDASGWHVECESQAA